MNHKVGSLLQRRAWAALRLPSCLAVPAGQLTPTAQQVCAGSAIAPSGLSLASCCRRAR